MGAPLRWVVCGVIAASILWTGCACEPQRALGPERLVASDDGLAVLWVRDQTAPEDAAISLTRAAGARRAYRLEPAGLRFEKPALLFARVPPTPEGGVLTPGVRLTADDGAQENLKTLGLAGADALGAFEAWTVAPIPHFSDAELVDYGDVIAKADNDTFFADRVDVKFHPSGIASLRKVGETWKGWVTLLLHDLEYVDDACSFSLSIRASGAVQLQADQSEVKGSLDDDSPSKQHFRLDFPVKCAEAGRGRVELDLKIDRALDSVQMHLARAVQCIPAPPPLPNPPPLAEPPPRSAADEIHVESIQLAELLDGDDPGELPVEEIRKLLVGDGKYHVNASVKFNVPCTRCPIGITQSGTIAVTALDANVDAALNRIDLEGEPLRLHPGSPPEPTGYVHSIEGIGLDLPEDETRTVPFTYKCLRPGPFLIRGQAQLSALDESYESLDEGYRPRLSSTETILHGAWPMLRVLCDGDLKGDETRIADTGTATNASGTWGAVAAGAAAVVRVLDDATRAQTVPINEHAILFQDVQSWGSLPGPELTLQTSRQSATATHDGSTYVVTGLVPGLAFDATDTLTVTSAAPATVTVNAPPALASPATLLGTPNGLRTEVRLPDGTFDHLIVRVNAASTSGESGLLRVLPAADLALSGADRVGPLLDDEAIEALTAVGFTLQSVEVGFFRSVSSTSLFPDQRAVPVYAGRSYLVPMADLGGGNGGSPDGGSGSDGGTGEDGGSSGVLVRSCSSLPFDFPSVPGRSGELGVLCVFADGRCFVSNDLRQDLPLEPSQCGGADRALVIVTQTLPDGGTGIAANPGNDWLLPWTSEGTDSMSRSSTQTLGADAGVVVYRIADEAQWRLDLRGILSGLYVERAAPHTGALPPYGQSFHALDLPRTFTSPTVVGAAQVYARLCAEGGSRLFVHGTIEATPEAEQCRTGLKYAAAMLTNSSGVHLDVSHPGGSDWVVTSTSGGTVTSGNDGVVNLPTGVDITTRLDRPYGGYPVEVVYQYTGSGFIVKSFSAL